MTILARLEAILNTRPANLLVWAIISGLLAKIGLEVPAECPPCAVATPAPAPTPPPVAPVPALDAPPDPDVAPSSLEGLPHEDDVPAMSQPPSTG